MDGPVEPDVVPDGDWGSDDEFEKSVLELDQSVNIANPSATVRPSMSTSSVVSVSKLSNIKPAKCSTPLPGKLIEKPNPVTSVRKMTNRDQDESGTTSKCDSNGSTLGNTISSRSSCAKPYGISTVSTKRKRRFPGPAGTLPKLTRDIDLKKLKETVAVQNDSVNELPEIPLSSQGSQSMSVSSNPAWKTLVEDLELSSEHLYTHSVRNALCNAAKKRLPDGKVPLLVVVIESINKALPDATATLRDLTDSMQGVIHRVLMKQHRELLKMGSALLLKQTSVFSPSPRRQYLNITPNNLLQIYSEDDKSAAILSTTVTKSGVPLDTLLTHPISCSSPVKSTPTTPVPQLQGLFTISKPTTRISGVQANPALPVTPVVPTINTHSSHSTWQNNLIRDKESTIDPATERATATSCHNTRLTNCVPVVSIASTHQAVTSTTAVSDVFGSNDDELSDLDLDDF